MPKSKNAVAILADKSWSVVEFNGGAHLRINSVIDVWPRKRRWMPTRDPQKARYYEDIGELKQIVAVAEVMRDSVLARIAALKDQPAMERALPKQITKEEWERMFR